MTSFLARPLTYLSQGVSSYLERAIDVLSPEWGNRRLMARAERGMLTELARIGANPRGAWRPASIGDTGSSESTRAQRERIAMMWESREIIQNFGFVKMLALKYADYVCGQIVYQPDLGDIGLEQAYHEYIGEWFTNCDLLGRKGMTFRKLVSMDYIGHKVDGDSDIIASFVDNDIKLQVVQADRIGNPTSYDYNAGYYSGVIVDQFGRPTAHRIFNRDRNNIYSNPVDILIDNIYHLINPLTADQYRGVTVMDTGIAPARQIFNIIQNETRAVNALSGYAALVSTKGNSAGQEWIQKQKALYARAAAEGVPPPQMPSQEIKPGTINYIADGDNITAFAYNRPSPAFNGLCTALIRDICNSWQADFNFFYDGNGGGGVVTRLGSRQQGRVFASEQTLLTETTVRPLIIKKLELGIARGDIPPHPRYKKMNIIYPEHCITDAARESAMDIEELKAGIQTLSGLVARDGGQIDQHLDRKGRDARRILDVAAKWDVPVTMIYQATPNANEAPVDPSAGSGGNGGGGNTGGGTTSKTTPPPPPATGTTQQYSRGKWSVRATELADVSGQARDPKGKWTKGSGGKSAIGRIANYVSKNPGSVLATGIAVAAVAAGRAGYDAHASQHIEPGREVVPGEDLRGKRLYRVFHSEATGTPMRHYGVGTEEGKVLHRTRGNSKLRAVKMETFERVGKGKTFVEHHATDLKPAEVMKRASAAKGTDAGKYSLFHQNCEHAANRIVEEAGISRQVRTSAIAAVTGALAGGMSVVSAKAFLDSFVQSHRKTKKEKKP